MIQKKNKGWVNKYAFHAMTVTASLTSYFDDGQKYI